MLFSAGSYEYGVLFDCSLHVAQSGMQTGFLVELISESLSPSLIVILVFSPFSPSVSTSLNPHPLQHDLPLPAQSQAFTPQRRSGIHKIHQAAESLEEKLS